MRMRRRNNLAPRMQACQSVWIQDPEAMRGDWRRLMPDCRELRVEVGCGKGKFTVETAAAEPDVLLIAIERVPDALVLAMEAAVRMGLKNVYFVSLDAANLEAFFAESEIDLLYINFCDPWPRSKNAKRRLTYHTFLEKYKYVLKLGGEIHFKTDNAKLFEWSLEEMQSCYLELRNCTRDLHANGPVGIMTGYEEKFHELGTPINRVEAMVVTKQKRPPEEKKLAGGGAGMTALSIGIIGGADGPTQVFVTNCAGSRTTIWLLAAALIAVGTAVLLLCRHKK